MDILHILKSKPGKDTELYIKKLSQNNQSTTINLYAEDIDWAGVVDSIFSHKKVVTWW